MSLHTWSGNYLQRDPLVGPVKKRNWNWIHPDFRGPNNTPQSCGSSLAVRDIDDAIDYAIKNMPVDKEKIFVIGASGGGHAACLNYLATQHSVHTTFAWVPITDIEAWYHQSLARKSKYAGNILALTQSSSDRFNVADARSRSPIYLHIPKNKTSRIQIYAGIHDGYSGSVPISHSLLFYNRLVSENGNPNDLVPASEIISLLSQGKPSAFESREDIGGRKVLYHKEYPLASITIFEGSHEMLVDYCLEQVEILISKSIY